ncbi:CDP-alcohol phosphatidyltransferase family protein [Thermococcus sp. 9N3]|uniref:CDP-alcohol phosphatidyltransferase family protein n=1 Tax=Thermococcus sp. 9N3 TaxID=163002 RepID=UPI00142F7F54|nr:CDP-alcohol phosphatidyltransferase family protein [Thermococcus sp. 9N3]NJE49562.1 CDP-alcohol phosphatidyltransferase family protein [Thermococcus sp. 9N3]
MYKDDRILKKVDAFTTVYFVDPLAVRLVYILSKYNRISPNFITTVSLFLGVSSAISFGIGKDIFGALFYYLSFLFDCVDGKLARITGKTSLVGAFYDTLADWTVAYGIYLGIAYNSLNYEPKITYAMLLFVISKLVYIRIVHYKDKIHRSVNHKTKKDKNIDIPTFGRAKLIPDAIDWDFLIIIFPVIVKVRELRLFILIVGAIFYVLLSCANAYIIMTSLKASDNR